MSDPTSPRRNRRRESRYATNDLAEVCVDPFCTRQPCVIVNASRSGLQLELTGTLPIRSCVEVLHKGMAIFGQVRYRRRAGEICRAGVHIDDVIFAKPLAPGEHIDEDRLSLYATGRGLTSIEVLLAGRHLEHCDQCRKTLGEVSKLVRFAHRVGRKARPVPQTGLPSPQSPPTHPANPSRRS